MTDTIPEAKPLKPFELPRISPWNELAVLALVGMETSWLALWLSFITRSHQPISYWRALGILGGMQVTVYLLARLLNALRIKISIRRGVFAILLILGLWIGIKNLWFYQETASLGEILRRSIQLINDPTVTIPGEFVALLMVLWAWWRGISLAGNDVDVESVRRSFMIGVVMLFIYGIIATETGQTVTPALFIFLFCWLVGMSTARFHAFDRLERGRSIPFDRNWIISVLAAVLAVEGIAALSAKLMSGRLSVLIASALIVLWRTILVLLMLLLSPLIILLASLLKPMFDWLQGFSQRMEFLANAVQVIQGALDKLQASNYIQTLAQYSSYIKIILLWGTLVVVFVLVLRAVRRRISSERRSGIEESSASVEEDLLQRLLSALREGAQSFTDRLSGVLGLQHAGRRIAAARIRRIYTNLLDLCTRLGKPRPPAWTPLEYLDTLKKVFPGRAAELETITSAYLKIRYGELPESDQEVEAVENAWRLIYTDGKQILKEYRSKNALTEPYIH